jgi:hypothetical protein
MLLQSWGNKIRVFPALPDAWDTVAFHNLRAEGGFLISARRIRGVTIFVRIMSLAGEPCVVSPAMSGKVKAFAKRKVELVELDSNCYRIELKKSEEVFLYQGDSKPDLFIG